MTRSGDIIDNKAFEAAFFLGRLEGAQFDMFAAQCYLSAFASATRSITFAIQACLRDSPGFEEWYRPVQTRLKDDTLCRFFTAIRNEGQKIGHTPLTHGRSVILPNGGHGVHYYFAGGYDGDPADLPTVDVASACRIYFVTLLQVVFDCYERFAVLSPLSYYSPSNMAARGETVEDLEEALGFPRGWTRKPEAQQEYRYHYLLRQFPDTTIDDLFLRFLGKRRSILDTE